MSLVPHSHLSIAMTPVTPEMFHQEVFEGRLRGSSEWVEESGRQVSELQPPPFKSLPVPQHLQEAVKGCVWHSQHVVGSSQLAVLGPVAR